MKYKAIVVQGEDWEGLYINGYLVDEGHTLNEGIERIEYFLGLSKQYEFDIYELQFISLKDNDLRELEDIGNLPQDIKKLHINDIFNSKIGNKLHKIIDKKFPNKNIIEID